jgi:hypothetical protein
MGIFVNIALGWFFGFVFGVGCALAVMYTIYTNGYKKGVFDGIAGSLSPQYLEANRLAQKKLRKLTLTYHGH